MPKKEIKISLCDNCKSEDGIVNCDAETCTCDCHYEIDELLRDELNNRRRKQ